MRVRRNGALLLTAVVVVSSSGCVRARNYLDRQGPRYAGSFPQAQATQGLKVVTFNIRYAREVDRAIDLLLTDASLRGADVVALQEMDRVGVQRIAEALGLAYVYYPAAFHPKGRKDFGNAVLVRGEHALHRLSVQPMCHQLGTTAERPRGSPQPSATTQFTGSGSS